MGSMARLAVDPSNEEQRRAWDGDEGAYWALRADHFERSLAAYDERFLAAAAVGATDRVLDVGCGTGHVVRALARVASGGSVLGVDLSAAMLEVARRRAEADGLGNVGFEQADAQIHPFPDGGFDVAVCRTAAMFFGDRAQAFANLGRAVRAGGRLVLLTWQPIAENEWLQAFPAALAAGAPHRPAPPPSPAAPGPFALADPERIESLLAGTGFRDVRIEALSRPMWFGHDADDAVAFVLGLLGWMLDGADEERRRDAVAALRATIEAHVTGAGVEFRSGAWLTTATRS